MYILHLMHLDVTHKVVCFLGDKLRKLVLQLLKDVHGIRQAEVLENAGLHTHNSD